MGIIYPLYKNYILYVSIPQAVSTIAMVGRNSIETDSLEGFNTASGKYYCNWTQFSATKQQLKTGFNTASGKYYCNALEAQRLEERYWVSIPQAVSTIAIFV